MTKKRFPCIDQATPAANTAIDFVRIAPAVLKEMLGDGNELALIDPREEGIFGQSHLLQAVNISLSKLELRMIGLVPRKTVRIVLCDDGSGLSEHAATKIMRMGYSYVNILEGGIRAWKEAGFELFSGMSVPTKAFGEWIAVTYHTPTISPEKLHDLISAGEDVIILDSRPPAEYVNMTIPGAINVPGSELVYRFPELSVRPETLVVVNCAGRTRSLIGAQTLINAGVRNRVVALRGGTMAWQLAGFSLEHGATRHAPEPWGPRLKSAQAMAHLVGERFGVETIDAETLSAFKTSDQRTLHIIDVRTPEEYRAGHRPDSAHAWGVQLVQSIDKYVGTHNARIVLIDNYDVRARMTASWLVQAGWTETYVLANPFENITLAFGTAPRYIAELDDIALPRIDAEELREHLDNKHIIVVDFGNSLNYKKAHIPGAWFAIRSRIPECLKRLPAKGSFVVTGDDRALLMLAGQDLADISGRQVAVLSGGNAAWQQQKFPVSSGFENMATDPDDIFRMPFLWGHFKDQKKFEAAAADYFAWELQLPDQLERADELRFSRPITE